MSVASQLNDISIGNEVFGSDGEKVGTVAEIYPGYIARRRYRPPRKSLHRRRSAR